jgi:hypothetical protein
MKKVLILMTIAIIGFASAVSAFDFSADVVSTAKGNSFTGKIYVSNDKIRMEAAGVTTITRMDKKVAWIIMPAQNMYMEQPMDPDSVAGAAEKMPGELSRTLIGPDTADGKPVDKYRVTYTSKQGETSILQWIDPAINIPLKTAAEDGSWTVEYKNLTVGAQPDDLFNVPAEYNKFMMPDMKEMMSLGQKKA